MLTELEAGMEDLKSFISNKISNEVLLAKSLSATKSKDSKTESGGDASNYLWGLFNIWSGKSKTITKNNLFRFIDINSYSIEKNLKLHQSLGQVDLGRVLTRLSEFKGSCLGFEQFLNLFEEKQPALVVDPSKRMFISKAQLEQLQKACFEIQKNGEISVQELAKKLASQDFDIRVTEFLKKELKENLPTKALLLHFSSYTHKLTTKPSLLEKMNRNLSEGQKNSQKPTSNAKQTPNFKSKHQEFRNQLKSVRKNIPPTKPEPFKLSKSSRNCSYSLAQLIEEPQPPKMDQLFTEFNPTLKQKQAWELNHQKIYQNKKSQKRLILSQLAKQENLKKKLVFVASKKVLDQAKQKPAGFNYREEKAFILARARSRSSVVQSSKDLQLHSKSSLGVPENIEALEAAYNITSQYFNN